jgi:hypothetical protein
MSETEEEKVEEEVEEEVEEIPMYCCLLFSYAVYYKFITIDMDRNSVDIRIRLQSSSSSLPDDVKKAIDDKLCKEHLTNLETDSLHIIHCPFCGLHMNHVIDFDKSDHGHLGQYSSKENWER